ncbi:hypothetical protein [Desulfogranum marinum]|uniref:hypothetical protein n=1 Tax=Desulfogranum marinum TaxID=453220 RepID=UPI0029C5FBDB|nr:hypothetical protein [Desulfogranum marinum]
MTVQSDSPTASAAYSRLSGDLFHAFRRRLKITCKVNNKVQMIGHQEISVNPAPIFL